MKLSARKRSLLIGYVESITALGLKVGIPAAILFIAYLLFVIFSKRAVELPKMSADDKKMFIQSVSLAATLLTAASVTVVLSLCIRLFYEELLGQILTIAGGLLFFISPAVLGDLTGGMLKGNPIFQIVASEFSLVGIICLLPGVDLVMRDAVIRIWNGISARKMMITRLWGDEDERKKKFKSPKIYGKCWDMAYCREFVRNVCPAWKQKKPCWRVKAGCYCDEGTILRALTSGGKENSYMTGILHSLGLDRQQVSTLTNAQKRARCRRCGIYAEHQRQKYRIMSPMMFPVVGIVFWLFYNQVSSFMWIVLERTDKFMSFLTYGPMAKASFAASQGKILLVLSMIWLAIMLLSYSLRALEYLIFDLQV